MDDELIERDVERAALDEALGAAIGGAGRLLVIEAAPGLGKTRLLARAAGASASATPARVLKARGSELESNFAFGVVHQLLDAVVLGAPDAAFEGAARLAQPIFTEVRPEAEDVLPLLHGLAWLVTGLAAERPLVLVSTTPSGRMSRRGASSPSWPSGSTASRSCWRSRRARSTTIPRCRSSRPTPRRACSAPTALTAEGTRAFLARANIDPAFTGACHASTGGNPFYLGELARELPAPNVTALGPRTIAAAVKRRLDPEALRLARAVAVLGDGADPATAKALADIEDYDTAARALAAAGVLEPGLTFAHPIVRSAVYADIPREERANAHAAPRRCSRTRRARNASPRTCSKRRPRATRTPSPRCAPRPAGRGSSGARAAPPRTSPARCGSRRPRTSAPSLLTELGVAESRAGIATATARLEQAIELATDEPTRTRAAIELARVLKFRGESVRAVPILATPGRRRPARGGARDRAAGPRVPVGRRTRGHHAPRRRPERRTHDPARSVHARARSRSTPARAATTPPASPSSPAVHSPATCSRPTRWAAATRLLIAGVALMWADELDAAAQLYAGLRAEARRQGSVVLLAAAAGQSALVNERRGALAEAVADAQEALALGREAAAPKPC